MDPIHSSCTCWLPASRTAGPWPSSTAACSPACSWPACSAAPRTASACAGRSCWRRRSPAWKRVPAAEMREFHRLAGAALVPYHLGRATTYAALGAAAGGARRGHDRRHRAALAVGGAAGSGGVVLSRLCAARVGAGLRWPWLDRARRERGWRPSMGRIIRPLFARPVGWRGYRWASPWASCRAACCTARWPRPRRAAAAGRGARHAGIHRRHRAGAARGGLAGHVAGQRFAPRPAADAGTDAGQRRAFSLSRVADHRLTRRPEAKDGDMTRRQRIDRSSRRRRRPSRLNGAAARAGRRRPARRRRLRRPRTTSACRRAEPPSRRAARRRCDRRAVHPRRSGRPHRHRRGFPRPVACWSTSASPSARTSARPRSAATATPSICWATKAEKIVPVLITVDPAARYAGEAEGLRAAFFHPRLVGLTGTPEQIAAVAKEYRVFYVKVAGAATPDTYLVDHSSLHLPDRAGRPLRRSSSATTLAAEEMADQLKQLL